MSHHHLFDTIYKRNQMERGVWQALTYNLQGHTARPIPNSIIMKIKKLLELDKLHKADSAPDYAFSMQDNPGLGNERKFSLMNCFSIAVALQLADAGFKQSDIIFILQHLVEELEEQFGKLSLYPMPSRQVRSPKQYPHLPRVTINGHERVDSKVFLVFHRVELPDIYDYTDKKDLPIVINHKFCYGLEALHEHLKKNDFYHSNLACLELCRVARGIQEFVPKVEAAKRGRKTQAIKSKIKK